MDEKQQSIVDRSDKLAETLIDTFGFTDSQLICSLAMNKIQTSLAKKAGILDETETKTE